MRVFLTGATGYVGGALARRLRREGHQVSALVRSARRAEPLVEIGAQTYPGDVTDRASMREGMSGADWVVHAAALLDPRAPAGEMRRVNVGGSENVASLAYKLGVGRFLSVSSIAYFGGSPDDGSAADEETPPRSTFVSEYAATKHAGERAIRGWERQGLPVNTVYPSLVYGPPGKREGAGSLLRAILRGRFPVMVGAGRKTSWVFLDDLVEGILRVLRAAPPGRAYLMAGEIVTVRQLFTQVATLGGGRPPRLELPAGLARGVLTVAGPAVRLFGGRLPFSSEQLAHLSRHWAFDDARARRELDWRPRPLAEGLPPTLASLRAAEAARAA